MLHTFQFRLCLSLALLCLGSGCPKSPSSESNPEQSDTEPELRFKFQNTTESSGVQATYENGRDAGFYAILESVGGGVGLFDLDKDGFTDLVFPGGGKLIKGDPPSLEGLPLQCYRGLGDLKWSDTSTSTGLGEPQRYTHGVSIADFNNDGFDDILVTGYGGVDLWENNGDGTFFQVAEQAELIDDSWSTSAGWGDLDGDGTLDLYLTHYVDWSFEKNPKCPSPSPSHDEDVCPPRRFEGLDDALFRSTGDGKFQDMSEAWGLAKKGKGLGVVLADIDNDFDIDIYVANDTVDNFLYINDGTGKLEESALLTGCAVDFEGKTNGSMGLEFFDFDGDLLGDLWVTNYEHESAALYRNQGGGNFLHMSQDTGVSAVGELFVSFGTLTRDFDGDADLDIAIANGHVIYHPNKSTFEQQSTLLENKGNQKFQRADFDDASFFSERHVSRGLAGGDLDRDGRTDLVFTVLNGAAQILRNETAVKGERIRMKLIGTTDNRNAIGARVVLHASKGDRVHFVTGGGSYLSSSEYDCDFYVVDEGTEFSATVFWPSGKQQKLNNLKPATDYFVVQGEANPMQQAAR